jgi:hypothetical protein
MFWVERSWTDQATRQPQIEADKKLFTNGYAIE